MRRFEYKCITVKPELVSPESIERTTNLYNSMGEEGWEIITIVNYASISTGTEVPVWFKRRIK